MSTRPPYTLRHKLKITLAFIKSLFRRYPRRVFNSVGHPKLPPFASRREISQYLRDSANWERLQPYGRDMDARQWAATCLDSVASRIEANEV